MAVSIQSYSPDLSVLVREFNARIAAGGWGQFQLPSDPQIFEQSQGTPLVWQGWLAVKDGVVRGGYLLRFQEFSFAGTVRRIGFYNLSISEGVVSRKYAPIGMQMINSAVAKQPELFALGMGGLYQPLPRMLEALGWTLQEVPFFFRPIRAGRVVRNIQTVRTTALRRAVLDVAAFTGAAQIGVALLQAFQALRAPKLPPVRYEITPDFGAWADEIWHACHAEYAMVALRDARALNALYPESQPRMNRLKVFSGNRLVGWVAVINTRMRDHKQFGNLHVGTIVDGMAAIEDIPLLVKAVTQFLERQRVDLIITNQSHRAWGAGLEKAGFLHGPSNFILGASKELSGRLAPFSKNFSRSHINRGDGDGPIHL